MFFIGVFGIDNKEKEIKILNNFCCKNCNESSEAKLIKTYSFFHFFFLPLFKWNEKYYVICNGCNSIFNISASSLPIALRPILKAYILVHGFLSLSIFAM